MSLVRAALPKPTGCFTWESFKADYPVLVSANGFWDPDRKHFRTPYGDLHELDVFLDSAGYSAMKLWKKHGTQRGFAGVFPWTVAEYVRFAMQPPFLHWAQMDLCCEQDIATDEEQVLWRVRATATALYATYMEVVACVAAGWPYPVVDPVPVVQGWEPWHYAYSVSLLHEVSEACRVGFPDFIAVGSVCGRPAKDAVQIYETVAALVPPTTKLHMFGVKGRAYQELRDHPQLGSVDSMAWDYAAAEEVKQHYRTTGKKLRYSNQLRTSHLHRWMARTQGWCRIQALKGGALESIEYGMLDAIRCAKRLSALRQRIHCYEIYSDGYAEHICFLREGHRGPCDGPVVANSALYGEPSLLAVEAWLDGD